ncbi:MAG: GHKL domain-containing protein [Candidatus Delongbacteria bacterium]|nr:GHKL domain-containing protein [Candidatus Delongbacteria bacterium]MBN2836460.1 GHKL domain-containing protein [Candidatus Delongbacteria bacterium]
MFERLKKEFHEITDIDFKLKKANEILNLIKETEPQEVQKEFAEYLINNIDKTDSVKLKSQSYTSVSLYHFRALEIDLALEYTFAAASYVNEEENPDELSRIYNNMGVFYSAIDLHDKAKECYAKSVSFNSNSIQPNLNLAQKYVDEHNFVLAQKYLDISFRICNENNDHDLLIQCYINKAEMENILGNYDIAEENLLIAKELNKKLKIARYDGFIEMGLGYTKSLKHEYFEALNHFEYALRVAKEQNNDEILWFAYQSLSNLYESIEEYKKQSEYLKLMLKFKEKVSSNLMNTKINYLEKKYKEKSNELEMVQVAEKHTRLASIGVMAAGITHEINQPLNSIMVNISGILYREKKEKKLSDNYYESIVQTKQAAERISSIISHMRSFWINDSNSNFEKINVDNTIKNALDLLKSQITSHSIVLNYKSSEEVLELLGNSIYLEQIIINLLVNSMQALDETIVNIKRIDLQTDVVNDFIKILVKDNGNGIENIENKDIFDPLFSTKKSKDGMGLGLAIVKHYVDSMSGKINYGNNLEGGAFFEIVFPKCVE